MVNDERTYQIGYWSTRTCILETTHMRLFFIIPCVAPKPLLRSPDIHTWFNAVSYIVGNNTKNTVDTKEELPSAWLKGIAHFMHGMDKCVKSWAFNYLKKILERSTFISTNFIGPNNNSLSVPNTTFDDEALAMIINKLLLCWYVLTYLLFGGMAIFDRSNWGFCHPGSLAKCINLNGPGRSPSNFDFVQVLLIRILFVTGGMYTSFLHAFLLFLLPIGLSSRFKDNYGEKSFYFSYGFTISHVQDPEINYDMHLSANDIYWQRRRRQENNGRNNILTYQSATNTNKNSLWCYSLHCIQQAIK